MKYDKVLSQIESGELTSQEALSILYPEKQHRVSRPGKRATFIKLKITVPEEGKGINTFLRILFALPIPMIFARLGLRIAKRFVKEEDEDFDINEISKMLKYSKNTRIQVDSSDAQIDIRVI
jgi:hypothetical protein